MHLFLAALLYRHSHAPSTPSQRPKHIIAQTLRTRELNWCNLTSECTKLMHLSKIQTRLLQKYGSCLLLFIEIKLIKIRITTSTEQAD
jgi:hypothetical protein